jgi:hypothetical protein
MERIRAQDIGWSPARGSYEEAVLSWQEQIDQSFRRRQWEPQRTGFESRSDQEQQVKSVVIAD